MTSERKSEETMTSKLRIGLTLFTGIGIGAVAMHGLHAQAKPPAYLISDVAVTDENGYKEYIEKFPPTLVPFGGKFSGSGWADRCSTRGGRAAETSSSCRVRQLGQGKSLE